MRKIAAAALIGALIVVVGLVGIFATGCGTIIGSAAPPAPTTPQGILDQAIANSGNLTSGTGDFNVSVNIDADAAKLPAGAGAILGQPIALSGTFAFDTPAKAAEINMSISVAGQNIPVALKTTGGKAWIQFMGQWYEAPADMMGAGATGTTVKPDAAGVLQALEAAGVDPTTWLTNLTLVGEDTIDGTATYHLTGTVDISKIMTDAVKLMQDKNFLGLMGSTGSGMMGGTDTSLPVPSQQEMQAIQSQIAQMFKNVTLDMWITKDTLQFRQVELNASIVPPAGEDTQGINGITVKATFSVAPATSPLTVTPPADAKPFTELEKALGALESLFSGALGGGVLGRSPTRSDRPGRTSRAARTT